MSKTVVGMPSVVRWRCNMGVPIGGRTGQLLCGGGIAVSRQCRAVVVGGVELQQVGNVRYGRGNVVEM